jgi:tetratricopeptide (TPR) repeat protein
MRQKQATSFPGLMLILVFVTTPIGNSARSDNFRRDRDSARLEPITALLLLDDYETFLTNGDEEVFRQHVSARYPEASLARLIDSTNVQTRRAAILALRLTGSINVNAAVAKALRDPDPVVRQLGESALWSIWFRADSPENNARLGAVATLISGGRLEEAVAVATKLIERAPSFAEAYNQRAIAEFLLGRYKESSEDCHQTLKRNRFHIGALSGLAECQLKLSLRDDALKSLRRASSLQPYHESLRQLISALEETNVRKPERPGTPDP